jgi:hypothetical protein
MMVLRAASTSLWLTAATSGSSATSWISIPSASDQALYAFLVEKGRRSSSRRTVES